jgi:choline kinase
MVNHHVLCINDKCVYPAKELIKTKRSKLEDKEMNAEMKLERFQDLGMPMIALHEKKHYVSPENDVFMVQYEDTMFPEDMYDELLAKIEDRPVKKEADKKKAKKEEGARVSKKKRKELKKVSKKDSKKKSR